MKMLWCWRCKTEVPMLDDEEYGQVAAHATSTSAAGADGLAAFVAAYNRVTGWSETNPNAVGHHRLSMYGPPCPQCGKPFRSGRASYCRECGHKRLLHDA